MLAGDGLCAPYHLVGGDHGVAGGELPGIPLDEAGMLRAAERRHSPHPGDKGGAAPTLLFRDHQSLPGGFEMEAFGKLQNLRENCGNCCFGNQHTSAGEDLENLQKTVCNIDVSFEPLFAFFHQKGPKHDFCF